MAAGDEECGSIYRGILHKGCVISAVFHRTLLSKRCFQSYESKTKVITLTNHTTHANNAMNQSELEANKCNRPEARENACEQVTIGFSGTSDWLREFTEVNK